MNTLYKKQAKELYKALLECEQTWTRSEATLLEWAEHFQMLHTKLKNKARIQRVLDWYTAEGCGALFVPLIGSAESFRDKFEKLDAARKRLKGQPLRYFDDVLNYDIRDRRTGSPAQREHARVMQRLQQQVAYVDDLVNGRATLPPPKATLRTKTKLSPFLKQAARNLTPKQRQCLEALLAVDREVMWGLMMQVPSIQQEFHDRLEKSGWWQPLAEVDAPRAMQAAMRDQERRDALQLFNL